MVQIDLGELGQLGLMSLTVGVDDLLDELSLEVWVVDIDLDEVLHHHTLVPFDLILLLEALRSELSSTLLEVD